MMKNNKNEKAKISHVTTVNRNTQCTFRVSIITSDTRHLSLSVFVFRIVYIIRFPRDYCETSEVNRCFLST